MVKKIRNDAIFIKPATRKYKTKKIRHVSITFSLFNVTITIVKLFFDDNIYVVN